jgi:adenosylcobinamide-phosphate synthase
MFLSHDSLWVLVLALLLDGLIGDPDVFWAHVPHPAVLMGRLIAALDRGWNDPSKPDVQRCRAGGFALLVLMSVAIGIGFGVEWVCHRIAFGSLVIALLASSLFAQRSLYDHIEKVRRAFVQDGVEAARAAVARVVGRDPDVLDEASICRAAIESCAENFSDGVVAPAFWFALFGLPGLIAYKIVNTADSMIGHKTPRHAAFGWASARFDDLLNLAPARLAGLLLSFVAPVAGGDTRRSLSIMWRDAGLHRSPNAGWPESAAAGALGLALAGPRQYARLKVDDPFLNPQGRRVKPDDIARMLRLLIAACGLELILYGALALFV